MSDPILAEESTITKLVPSLKGILKELNESATHYDYLVALSIVLLAESGFYVSTTCNSSERQKLRSLSIPKNWKSKAGVYEISFQLHTFPDVKCKFVAIPSGDTLIINFYSIMEEKKAYSLAVQTLKYINPFSSDLCGRYTNLKEICYRFKDTLASPVRSDILIKAGLICPSLLGLPIEMKLTILGMLEVQDLTRIAQCCTEFRELCLEPQLWKDLLRRDFSGDISEPAGGWRDYYRVKYKKRQRRVWQTEVCNTIISSPLLDSYWSRRWSHCKIFRQNRYGENQYALE